MYSWSFHWGGLIRNFVLQFRTKRSIAVSLGAKTFIPSVVWHAVKKWRDWWLASKLVTKPLILDCAPHNITEEHAYWLYEPWTKREEKRPLTSTYCFYIIAPSTRNTWSPIYSTVSSAMDDGMGIRRKTWIELTVGLGCCNLRWWSSRPNGAFQLHIRQTAFWMLSL